MPISRKHKSIFIHIPKTGGTSITCGLGIEQTKENLHGTELSHLTANQIKERIDQGIWHQFFKFAVVRNPFDRLVSEWAYQKKPRSFKDFALGFSITSTHFVPQHNFINDEVEVYRFEEYEVIKEVLEKKGCHIPHMNKSKRSDYREYYDTETRAFVENAYQADLQRFDYRF